MIGKIKVGIIGCGTIGSEIARACQGRLSKRLDVVALSDMDRKKAEDLNKRLKKKISILNIDDLVKRSNLVVEAASAKISAHLLAKCIKAGRDILIMSVGGLLGREGLLRRAETCGIKVYIPSGAISGIDGLKSAAVGNIYEVMLTTRKPPKSLKGAPYLKKNNIDIDRIRKETIIFDGNAKGAVKGFPQNINVSAVLSLAGIGAARTRVRIVTAPHYTENIHEVQIRGSCGKISTCTENVPSAVNPKTSALAVSSAIATLEGITKNVRIGT